MFRVPEEVDSAIFAFFDQKIRNFPKCNTSYLICSFVVWEYAIRPVHFAHSEARGKPMPANGGADGPQEGARRRYETNGFERIPTDNEPLAPETVAAGEGPGRGRHTVLTAW